MAGRTRNGTAGGGDAARWWRAVLARDRRADGTFVYAVTSTGIYCRPSCPSRRPHRGRVRFFAGPDEAERAGFRACRRCRPGASAAAAAPLAAVVAHAARCLEAPVGRALTLEDLGRIVGLAPGRLRRAFTRLLGVSPREYRAACRAGRFRRALGRGLPVTEAIYEAGYGSPSRVYDAQPTGAGVPPARYRRGGAGLRLHVSVVGCALGRLLVAATAEGVCAVKLGDSAAELMDELRREFPAAEIVHGRQTRSAWVRAVVEAIDGRSDEAEGVPLDVRGTAFQQRVWRALRRIPAGQTRTYGEIARAIGRPAATRAVARACASNPVAVLVPCHRAVPKAGGTGGYRWGAARKATLLEEERRRAE